jgi:membrane-associated phospholipid phosphatase
VVAGEPSMAREGMGLKADVARFWRLLVALGAIIALIVMTADILLEGSLRAFDGTVSEIFDTRAGLSLRSGLVFLAFISEDKYAVGLVIIVLLAATVTARSLRPALTVVGTMAANYVVIEVMKFAFGRTAPDTGEDLFGVDALSYPSGHSANTIIIWTLLLRIVFGLWGDRIGFLSTPMRRFAVVSLLAVVFGMSLVGLNYHWLTDIVAGWLIGIALSMLAPSPLPFHLRPENRHLRDAQSDGSTSASTNPARAFGMNQVLLRGIFSRARLTDTKSETETGATKTAAAAAPASTSAASHDGP